MVCLHSLIKVVDGGVGEQEVAVGVSSHASCASCVFVPCYLSMCH